MAQFCRIQSFRYRSASGAGAGDVSAPSRCNRCRAENTEPRAGVKGANFISLHELFDKTAEEVKEYTDEIAERSVQLGGTAFGTIQRVASGSRLPAYPLHLSAGIDHVTALSNALARFGASTRSAIAEANKAGDADTVDLFTEVSRGIDKLLWMVESHLHAKS